MNIDKQVFWMLAGTIVYNSGLENLEEWISAVMTLGVEHDWRCFH